MPSLKKNNVKKVLEEVKKTERRIKPKRLKEIIVGNSTSNRNVEDFIP